MRSKSLNLGLNRARKKVCLRPQVLKSEWYLGAKAIFGFFNRPEGYVRGYCSGSMWGPRFRNDV